MSTWMENLDRLLAQKEVLILHGNVRDTQYIQPDGRLVNGLSDLLRRTCTKLGFNRLVSWGVFWANKQAYTPMWSVEKIENLPGDGTSEARQIGSQAKELQLFGRWLEEEIRDTRRKTAFVVHYLDKVTPYSQSGNYSRDAALVITMIEKLIENIPMNHRLILVALRDTMVPLEFYTNSPKTAVLEIPPPRRREREMYWTQATNREPLEGAINQEGVELLANISDGLFFRDLENVREALDDEAHRSGERFSMAHIRKVVNLYRLGTTDDPWAALPLSSPANAEDPKGLLDAAETWFKRHVIGQDHAVTSVVKAIKKARAGVVGLASGQAAKPRAVFFFAGASGVGKTFLAKKLAEYLFGTEDAFIRCDMSEFKEEHTVSKLIGAPPGYIGYEEGGMLTNAVKSRPFCVILFDEVEKAHPKIMDIFLQVLDDGRLTDSRGQTVFFTEAVIIFTSNIGTRTYDSGQHPKPIEERAKLEKILEGPAASPEERAQAVREHFIHCVREFFIYEISRPELLNRIGSQIIAFNYIDDPSAMQGIVEGQLVEIARNFADRFSTVGHRLEVGPAVKEYFLKQHSEAIRRFGGRGLVNVVDDEIGHLLAHQVLLAEQHGWRALTLVLDVQSGRVVCRRKSLGPGRS